MDQSADHVSQISKNLDIQEQQVLAAVNLLDAGNTIHFISRYRKDETGGLGESKLQSIRLEAARIAALNERKATILEALENQGKLTADLKSQIEQANQSRKIEDLYLPFKPKKSSEAEAARQQGLEPLARDILEGHNPEVDLASRATDFVRVDKGLNSIDEVIEGVKHILAERFSENLKLRKQLRKLFWDKGELRTELIPLPEPKPVASAQPDSPKPESEAGVPGGKDAEPSPNSEPVGEATVEEAAVESPTKDQTEEVVVDNPASEAVVVQQTEANSTDASATEAAATEATATEDTPNAPAESEPAETGSAQEKAGEQDSITPVEKAAIEVAASEEPPKKKKKRKKKKKKKAAPDPFAEFKDFKCTLAKLAPHQTLTVNRGERANRINSQLFLDENALSQVAQESLVSQDHPFAEFLKTVCDHAMEQLIVPSVDREIRRELTDRAETHAVNVFAKNLKHLYLQPPMTGRRILGIDPGYRSGCKMAVIDEQGAPLAHGVFSIVGNKERIDNNKKRLIDMISQHKPDLIAIGNGSGCRVVEQFVSEIFAEQLKDQDLRYSIVSQAGTAGYSTSELAQTDLPDHDPVIRSAISIARRLQDPLAEFVKVNPANVGVGMYQHDVKGKHLADSLRQVVGNCVNSVGVDVNQASLSMLQYVSGMDDVTARKMVEHRSTNGPFKTRDGFKQVPGLGDVTFVQAAGFMRVEDGELALDSTSIHPEDYEVANKILSKLDCKLEELVLPRMPLRRSAKPTEITAQEATTGETSETNTSESSAASSTESAAEAPEQVAIPSTADSSNQAEPVSQPQVTAGEASAVSPAIFAEKKKRRNELVQKIKALDPTSLAQEFGIGEMKIRDLLRAIRNPQHDPRREMPAPVLRKGILKFEDLKQGDQLRGQIVNVVDFGVFLNIGIGESCLVHISRLANRFVRDPHWLYAVGDVLNVWVQEVDSEKRRVTLTAIRPDSAKRENRKRRSDRGEGSGRGNRSSGGAGKRFGGKGRPQNARKSKSYEKRSNRKPKPVTPISQEMVEGKAPMRSFSDLLQFHKKKNKDSEKE